MSNFKSHGLFPFFFFRPSSISIIFVLFKPVLGPSSSWLVSFLLTSYIHATTSIRVNNLLFLRVWLCLTSSSQLTSSHASMLASSSCHSCRPHYLQLIRLYSHSQLSLIVPWIPIFFHLWVMFLIKMLFSHRSDWFPHWSMKSWNGMYSSADYMYMIQPCRYFFMIMSLLSIACKTSV